MFVTPLYDMAARGDADAVRRHLDRGVPVNQRDGDGATALHLATREAHVQFVQLLLVARADVERTYAETPATAIYLVIMMLNQVVVEAVLERKPALEGRVNGLTPLFIAVSAGNDRIAELLLDAGADAKAITTTSVGTGESVLHMAIASFRNDLVPLLIRHGADVDVAAVMNGRLSMMSWEPSFDLTLPVISFIDDYCRGDLQGSNRNGFHSSLARKCRDPSFNHDQGSGQHCQRP
ncbi:hypothetical protein PWT90_00400 [Aphanocladium album]|nr:hypothetical protein PWT90_00400 [Aphanocladium album]